MFDASELERVRKRLLELASADPDVIGAAIIGSHALGNDDRWSDIDLAVGVSGPLPEALQRWTRWLHDEFDVMHHWDLPSGPSIYRLFLLPGQLRTAWTQLAHRFRLARPAQAVAAGQCRLSGGDGLARRARWSQVPVAWQVLAG